MQPRQDPSQANDPASLRQRPFIEYLQHQQLLLQQRQQTSNPLPFSQSNSTENTNPSWNPLNLSSGFTLSTFTSSSPTSTSLQTGSVPDNSPNPQQNPYNQEYLHFEQEEAELIDDNKDEENNDGPSGSAWNPYLDHMPTTSDFVKKLYRMLEQPKFQPIMCWGPIGDCFIVKDVQECRKSVLPRVFRHSNFSSFVRQLNKYGFHKVKYPESSQFGEHSWVFRHPYFRAGQPEALEKIKRKPSTRRKTVRESTSAPPTAGPSSFSLSASTVTRPVLCRQLSALQEPSTPTERLFVGLNQDLENQITTLERTQEGLRSKMINFQQGLAQRNEFFQNLIARSFQSPSASTEACLDASTSNLGPNTNLQAYPLTFQPPDLGLEPQQGPISNMTRQSESTFRLIQPFFDPGDLIPRLQSQSTSTSSRSRSHRLYSANDAEAPGSSSILDRYSFSDDAEGDT